LWIVADHQVHATRPPGFDGFPLQRKLARLGTGFGRAYSVLPICSPARASMLTGLYPHAHGLTENDGRFGGREGLDPSEWMVHQPLREAGYRCGWFGKWHVDNRHSALDYGFEGFSLPGYGYPYASEAYREYLGRKGLGKPVARVLIRNESDLAPGAEIDLVEDSDWFDCVSGVAALEGPLSAHEACFVSELAARWLDSLNGEAFFLRVDPWGPHPPYLLGEPFLGMLDERDIRLPENFHSDLRQRPDHHRRYRDYWRRAVGLDDENWRRQYQHALEHVMLVETALGELLEHVDLANTLVVFNSDHGDAVGSNGGIANKGDLMVEATMQIPLLLAGNGVAAGKTCDELVSNLDLAPTLLDLCGIDGGREMHGASLAGLLNGRRHGWRRGLMTQHYGLQEPIVQRAWYRDDCKLIVRQDGYRELYDLARDPGELHNLALDSRQRGALQSMQRELLQAMRDVADNDEGILDVLQATLA
jgi:arylsulfatase A-like enzyme